MFPIAQSSSEKKLPPLEQLHPDAEIIGAVGQTLDAKAASNRVNASGHIAPALEARILSVGSSNSMVQVGKMTQEAQQVIPQKQYAVLLIDDNAVQAAIRQTILKRAGYFVIAALHPGRALEQLQAGDYPAEVCAVITDHIMPGMSGSQFVRELRKTHPDLPVMVVSGLEEAEPEYDDLNVVFLLKPLSPELLLSNLGHLLQQDQQGAA
jgi:CheY-like chemotaxis protein